MSFDDDMFDSYDSATRYADERGETYNPKTDQWLPTGDPRLPKPKRSNGWNQVNTRTKETHMPERLTKAQIEHELEVNTGLMTELRTRRNQLKKQLQTALPSEPPPGCTMFTVDVQFKFRGKRYQFLVLRSGMKYFTTGSSPEHKKFETWVQLCGWLEGPDVYSHSGLEVLKSAGKVVSFESGRLENLPTEPAPF